MNAYASYWKNCFSIKGRCRRRDLLHVFLINSLISFVLSLFPYPFGGGLASLFFLISIVPTATQNIRRLHDIGKSGWIYLLCMSPLVTYTILTLLSTFVWDENTAILPATLLTILEISSAFIVLPLLLAGLVSLVILLLKDSQPGSNAYGENPKGISNDEDEDEDEDEF